MTTDQWFCHGCRTVWSSNETVAREHTLKCLHRASAKIEVFDPAVHGDLLVGGSNSWHTIENAAVGWEDDPTYQQVREERARNGNYGYATNIVAYVNRLRDLCGINEGCTTEEEAFDEWFDLALSPFKSPGLRDAIREIAWGAWKAGGRFQENQK